MYTKEIIYGIIVACLLFSSLLILLVVFLFFYLKNKRKFQEEKQILELKHQQAIFQSEIEIQEQTLKNIALELHDNIGQVLTVTKIQLNQFLQNQSDPMIVKAHQSTSIALDLLRKLTRSLNQNDLTEDSFFELIKKNVQILKEVGGFEINLEQTGKDFSLDYKTKILLFRSVQEILTNALKHAKCTQVDIKLYFLEEEIKISIQDNGIGFDPILFSGGQGKTNKSSGSGLEHIKTRIQLIGGEISLESSVQIGTLFQIIIKKDKL